jgi:flagellar hook protein FlgE
VTITDVKVSSFTSAPSETKKMAVIVNLDADATNNAIGSNTALSEKWNGENVTGNFIADEDYEYLTTIKSFDSLGRTHDVVIYFDPGEAASDPVWEYMVTCNPSEDKRTITESTHKGLLARGTIEFDASSGGISGAANSITCAVNNGDGTWTDLTNAEAEANGGYFCFSPEFISGTQMSVKLDFGSRYNGSVWASDSLSTSQYASASTTVFQSADGYGAGDLESITVGTDGCITGQYSNGQIIPLYRAALAKFQNNQGLYKAGGNLFKGTRLSGDPITGKPGTNGLGTISPNSLELSNVDIATEFVKMITTQRGFQANSKIITVTDQMLADLINIRR